MNHEQPPPSFLFRFVLPLMILGGGIFALTAAAVWGGGKPAEKKAGKPDATQVLVVTAQSQTEGLDLDVDGVVVPSREITLAAEVAGRVLHKDEICEAGNYVTKGTPLLEIDPRDYQAEVDRLTEEVAQADVSLKELTVQEKNTKSLEALAQATLKLQEEEVARIEKLAPDHVVTEAKVNEQKRQKLAAENALVTLQNQLRTMATQRDRLTSAKRLAEVGLRKARLDLDRTKIVAPITGMIVREFVESDTYLNRGAALVTMEDTSSVEVRCNLRVDQLHWVWNQPGAPVHDGASYRIPPTGVTVIYSLAGRDYAWEGVLDRYDGIGLDEATRTVPCIVVVDKPRDVRLLGESGKRALMRGPAALVRGMYVRLKIHTKPDVPLIRLPENAVRPGKRVWVMRDGELQIRTVRVVGSAGDDAVVEADPEELSVGDKVITSQLTAPFDGMKVTDVPPKDANKKPGETPDDALKKSDGPEKSA
ncbi:MAG: hypothetical protein JW818_17715 [Pirellulales bacterium]|nr:hypothetical protein [Pirellulales bacterium]